MIVTLSEAGIKDAVQRIKVLQDNIEVASQNAVERLVEKGFNLATAYNTNAPQSGLEKSRVIAKVTKSGHNGYIALTGPNAVYDEFGTGEQGAGDPHPMKGQFGLNPYNSGPTIFYNEFAGRYQWRYYPMKGRPYFTEDGYTEGIPSGKQMYNTAKDLRAVKNEIVIREIENAVKRFR